MSRGFGGLRYNAGGFAGTSITLGVRPGVVATQTIPYLVGQSKKYVPCINAGVGGETSTQILARFERDVLAFGPSMISVEAGHNDPGAGVSTSTYSANMTEMIRKAKITGARVTIFISILAQDGVLDASIAPYRTIARNLASTYSCDLFDTYADMAALPGATQNSYFLEAAGSGQHLSPAGLAWAAGLVGAGAYLNAFKSAVK